MEVKTDQLPEPFMWIGRRLEEWIDGTPVYSASQIRAFGESCARMAREEAAKLVDEYEFPSIAPHNPEDAEIAKCAGEVLRWRLLNPLAAAIRKG